MGARCEVEVGPARVDGLELLGHRAGVVCVPAGTLEVSGESRRDDRGGIRGSAKAVLVSLATMRIIGHELQCAALRRGAVQDVGWRINCRKGAYCWTIFSCCIRTGTSSLTMWGRLPAFWSWTMTASTISSLTVLRSILEALSAASFISTEDALDLGGDGGSLFEAG